MARALLTLTFLAAAISCTHALKTTKGNAAVQAVAMQAVEFEDDSSLDQIRALPMRIMGVVMILKKFQIGVMDDKKEDANATEALRTWCETNKKSKGEDVLNGEADVKKLTAAIEENTAKSAGLKTAIAASIAAYESDKESLAEVTALREKEVAEFQQTMLDLPKYIQQLDAAIITLGKHASAAFPQMPPSFLQSRSIDDDDEHWGMESEASRSLDAMMESNGLVVDSDESSPAPRRKPRTRFLQSEAPTTKAETAVTYHDYAAPAPMSYHDYAAPAPEWSAADIEIVRQGMHVATLFLQNKHEDTASLESPETAEIVGILKQMKDEMTEDLAKAKQTELEASESFEKLRKSKTEEIEGDLKSKEEQEDEKAETDNSLADDKEELANTVKTLAEDEKFLASINKKCDAEIKAYEERQATRDEEILAINEAMTLLGVEPNATMKSDGRGVGLGNATENTSFLLHPSFVQVSSKTHCQSKARSKAAQLLRSAAWRSNDVELSLLAASTQSSGLDKVVEEIDKMVAQLKLNQQTEVDENDDCKEKLGTSAADISKLEQELKEIATAKEKAEASVLEKEKKYTLAEQSIVKLRQSIMQAELERSNEKAVYENLVQTTSFTLEFMIKALYRLARFYDKKNAAALLQQVVSINQDPNLTSNETTGALPTVGATATAEVSTAGQAPPPMPETKEYEAKKGNSVLQLLGKLINDAQKLLREAARDEAESVKSFEELKADTEESIKLAQEAMTSLKAKKADLKKKLNDLKSDKSAADSQLAATKSFQEAVMNECRDLMNNFDETQQARQNEIEALQQTKQILRGASFDDR